MMLIKVVDNFLEDPQLEQVRALLAEYKDVNVDGVVYPKIATHTDVKSLAKVEEILGVPVQSSLPPFYRKYIPDEPQPTFIHSDVNEGDYTLIVFLNETNGPDNGLAFWRHKDTGVVRAGSFDAELLSEGLDETKWTKVAQVEMKWNRAIIFDARLYHSRWPRENWSTDLDNNRIIKVLFMRDKV